VLVFSAVVWGALVAVSGAFAAGERGAAPISDTRSLFVPVGFNDNNEVVVVLDGYLGGDCYELRAPRVNVDLASHRIQVEAMAERVQEYCHLIALPFTAVVPVGVLPVGTYTVIGGRGRLHQTLDVVKARVATGDDYPYAGIQSLRVGNGPTEDSVIAILRGKFTNTCQKIGEMRVTHTGPTIQIQPILAVDGADAHGEPCADKIIGFEKKVEIDGLSRGRYLIHVRSAAGQSRNEVIDFPLLWED
jgi:hypothetical protein